MNNKGKIDIGGFIGLVFLIAIIIGILGLSGVIDLQGIIKGETPLFGTNYEEKVKKLCEKLDVSGNYQKEEYEKVTKDIKDAIAGLNENTSYEEGIDKAWEIMKGSEFCLNKVCTIIDSRNNKKMYMYGCEEKEYKEVSFKDMMMETRKSMTIDPLLSTGCSTLNSKGEYSYKSPSDDNFSVDCKNWVCRATVDGKEYKRDCKTGETR